VFSVSADQFMGAILNPTVGRGGSGRTFSGRSSCVSPLGHFLPDRYGLRAATLSKDLRLLTQDIRVCHSWPSVEVRGLGGLIPFASSLRSAI
jgi:hypothetical protein